MVDGAQVVVTEGEGPSQALGSMGITAVGTVTGANGSPGEEALTPLLRLSVVLWPDADSPGERHMERVGARLTAFGCPVRWVNWLEAPQKGAAADAVAQG